MILNIRTWKNKKVLQSIYCIQSVIFQGQLFDIFQMRPVLSSVIRRRWIVSIYKQYIRISWLGFFLKVIQHDIYHKSFHLQTTLHSCANHFFLHTDHWLHLIHISKGMNLPKSKNNICIKCCGPSIMYSLSTRTGREKETMISEQRWESRKFSIYSKEHFLKSG